MFESLVETFSAYPYLGVALVFAVCAIGLPLPEEIVLIAAGYVCAKFPDQAHVGWMMFWSATSILGFDCVPYLLGRVFGTKLLRIRWLRVIVTRRGAASLGDGDDLDLGEIRFPIGLLEEVDDAPERGGGHSRSFKVRIRPQRPSEALRGQTARGGSGRRTV